MKPPLSDRRAVEAAVASLQERLADGDPGDAALRKDCAAALSDLRAAYRADRALFSPETIAALQELREVLSEAGPASEPAP
ncbi:MAG: hypothetical protein NTY77_03830 [Elusimicrobia bacterium]|nr:hypothetical protein [Elusimicrobiota bacterium]